MNQQTDYKPAALYARVPSDRQDVDCPSPHSCERVETTPRRTATWSPAST